VGGGREVYRGFTPATPPKPFLKERFWIPKNLNTGFEHPVESVPPAAKTLFGKRVLDSQKLYTQTGTLGYIVLPP
jgi:hypothetical protein